MLSGDVACHRLMASCYEWVIQTEEVKVGAGAGSIAVEGEPTYGLLLPILDHVGPVILRFDATTIGAQRCAEEFKHALKSRLHVGEGHVVVERKAIEVLEQLDDYLPRFRRVGERGLKLLLRSAQLGIAERFAIELVVGEPLGELAEHLAAQVLRDVALLVDLAERLRNLLQLLVEQ